MARSQPGGLDRKDAYRQSFYQATALFECGQCEDALALLRDAHTRSSKAHGEFGLRTLVLLQHYLARLLQLERESEGETLARRALAALGEHLPFNSSAYDYVGTAVITISRVLNVKKRKK